MKFRIRPGFAFFRGTDAQSRAQAFGSAGGGSVGNRVARPNAREGQVIELTPRELAALSDRQLGALEPVDDAGRARLAGIPPAPPPNRPALVGSLDELRAGGGLIRDAKSEARL